jgi:recombination protein RecT
MSTGLITIPKPLNAAAQVVSKRIDVLRGLVPTASIDPDLWLASLMIEVNGLTKEVSPVSIGTAALNAAYLGLQFGKSLGHAFIIPYGKEATLVVGYKGLRHLAFQTGFLKTLHPEVVCRGEEFTQWNDENGAHFRHVPAHERDPNRDNITHAYLVYETMAGGKGTKILPRSEINRSDKQRDVWNSDYRSMCLKTAIIKASKEWNTTSRLAHAVSLDEQTERDESQSPPPGVSAGTEEPAFVLPVKLDAVAKWKTKIDACQSAVALSDLNSELHADPNIAPEKVAEIELLFVARLKELP